MCCSQLQKQWFGGMGNALVLQGALKATCRRCMEKKMGGRRARNKTPIMLRSAANPALQLSILLRKSEDVSLRIATILRFV